MIQKTFPFPLIGKEIELIPMNSSNSDNPLATKLLRGKIIDETKHTLKIKSEGKIRTLFKRGIRFRLKGSTNTGIIEGASLVRRPEERIKG